MKANISGVVPYHNEEINMPNVDTLYVFTGRLCSKIKTRDIEFIEKDMRKITINTFDNRYEVYEAFETVEKYLKGKNFYKPLKGTIINFDLVKNIDKEKVCFESGENIMFGRNTICKIKNAFKNYIRDTITYAIYSEEIQVAEKRKCGKK